MTVLRPGRGRASTVCGPLQAGWYGREMHLHFTVDPLLVLLPHSYVLFHPSVIHPCKKVRSVYVRSSGRAAADRLFGSSSSVFDGYDRQETSSMMWPRRIRKPLKICVMMIHIIIILMHHSLSRHFFYTHPTLWAFETHSHNTPRDDDVYDHDEYYATSRTAALVIKCY